MIAATGGHLAELHRLSQRLEGVVGRRLWVTFDSAQSRSLLAGEDVIYVRLTAPRDYRNVLRNTFAARRILRAHNVQMVISTGSAVALSFFPLAWLQGASCHFIETAARCTGPSLTGRLLGLLPGVRRYTQCKEWASRRWLYRGSLFDGFSAAEAPEAAPAGRPINVVVMLGTMKHSFEAALQPLARAFDHDDRFTVHWQVGNTPTNGLDIAGHVSVSPQRLREWIDVSDLVIAHAGMGSTLDALEAGRRPILIPRRARRGEHVDDHQEEFARVLADRGLAERVEPDEITIDRLRASIGARVLKQRDDAALRFELDVDRIRKAA